MRFLSTRRKHPAAKPLILLLALFLIVIIVWVQAGFAMVIRDLAPAGVRGLVLVAFFAAANEVVDSILDAPRQGTPVYRLEVQPLTPPPR